MQLIKSCKRFYVLTFNCINSIKPSYFNTFLNHKINYNRQAAAGYSSNAIKFNKRRQNKKKRKYIYAKLLLVLLQK